MDFAEYVCLHNEHERLKWTYRTAVDLLFDTGYLLSETEYLELKASVDNAKHNLALARLKLEAAERGEGRTAGAGAE